MMDECSDVESSIEDGQKCLQANLVVSDEITNEHDLRNDKSNTCKVVSKNDECTQEMKVTIDEKQDDQGECMLHEPQNFTPARELKNSHVGKLGHNQVSATCRGSDGVPGALGLVITELQVTNDREMVIVEEGKSSMDYTSHSAKSDSINIQCRQRKDNMYDECKPGVSGNKYTKAKVDDLIVVASTSDNVRKDVEVRGIGVEEVLQDGMETRKSAENADSTLPDGDVSTEEDVSPVAKSSLSYKNEDFTPKSIPKKSKAMMSIRRKHSDRVMRNMDQMRRENFLCDVELEAAGGIVFKAHRSVLVAACSYFRAMFSSGLLEGKESRVKMTHLSPQTMSTILQFIYTGDLLVGLDEVQELMVVADMLQMEDVIEGCTQLMHDEMDPSNALGIYRFAEAHNCTAMSKMAERYVKVNFVDIVKSDEFLALPLLTLTHFLSSEGLEVDSEMQVFESAVRWLFHDPPNRRQHVFEVLRNVRLGLLHPELMSLRVSKTIRDGDPPLGVALAAIRVEVEEKAKGQHLSGHEDAPRRGAKKRIVVVGGCRREPIPPPYRSPGIPYSYSQSNHQGDVLCAAIEVFDVYHKEWYGQGISGTSHSYSSEDNGRGPPPLLNPRILPGVAAMGGIIYVVGGEFESQILANVEALDARACFLSKDDKVADAEDYCKTRDMSIREGGSEGGGMSDRSGRERSSSDAMEEEEEDKRKRGEKEEGEEDDDEEEDEEEDEGEARGEKRKSEGETGVRLGSKRGRRLDPIRWARMSSMVVPRCEFGLCSSGGRLYAIGGWVGSDVDSSIESYDPIADEWHLEGNLPKPCSGIGVVSYEGLIYIVGGCTRHRRHLPYLQCLEPPYHSNSFRRQKSSTWCSEPVRLASMHTPRSQMGVAVLHDSIYAIGGTNGGSDALRSVERYSFAENKWYEVSPLREARATPSVVALDGRLYAIGGTSMYQIIHYETQVSLKTVEVYDPVADLWSEMPSMPHARGEAGAVVI